MKYSGIALYAILAGCVAAPFSVAAEAAMQQERLQKVRDVKAAQPVQAAANPSAAGKAAGKNKHNAFNPERFGAKGDGVTLDTAAIQKAIDTAAESGGGTVRIESGIFLTGTLFLRSNVTIDIANTGVLRGSGNPEDYTQVTTAINHLRKESPFTCLIYAEGQENVALTGDGIIDGQGTLFMRDFKGVRPFLIRFSECKNVEVKGLTLINSANWLAHFMACSDVLIDGITIRSRIRANRDGIDIDGCTDVIIRNCDIYSGDDAIVIKSTISGMPNRNILVENCVLSALPGALKLGTESHVGFENITFRDCYIYDSRDGIVIQSVDGATCNNINVSNITMRNVDAPIFVRLGNRARTLPGEEKPGVGSINNVTISNVTAQGANKIGCAISGIPGHPVDGITLRDINIEFSGGGSEAEAKRIPREKESSYPRATMFGTLPAYGMFLRHAHNVTLDNVVLTTLTPDARPAIVIGDDVKGLSRSGQTAEPVALASETAKPAAKEKN